MGEFLSQVFCGGAFCKRLILPSAGNLSGAFSAIPSGMWWLMDMMQFNVEVPMVISAYLTRFIIRRIPIIG
jgi:hypothetical protein